MTHPSPACWKAYSYKFHFLNMVMRKQKKILFLCNCKMSFSPPPVLFLLSLLCLLSLLLLQDDIPGNTGIKMAVLCNLQKAPRSSSLRHPGSFLKMVVVIIQAQSDSVFTLFSPCIHLPCEVLLFSSFYRWPIGAEITHLPKAIT